MKLVKLCFISFLYIRAVYSAADVEDSVLVSTDLYKSAGGLLIGERDESSNRMDVLKISDEAIGIMEYIMGEGEGLDINSEEFENTSKNLENLYNDIKTRKDFLCCDSTLSSLYKGNIKILVEALVNHFKYVSSEIGSSAMLHADEKMEDERRMYEMLESLEKRKREFVSDRSGKRGINLNSVGVLINEMTDEHFQIQKFISGHIEKQLERDMRYVIEAASLSLRSNEDTMRLTQNFVYLLWSDIFGPQGLGRKDTNIREICSEYMTQTELEFLFEDNSYNVVRLLETMARMDIEFISYRGKVLDSTMEYMKTNSAKGRMKIFGDIVKSIKNGAEVVSKEFKAFDGTIQSASLERLKTARLIFLKHDINHLLFACEKMIRDDQSHRSSKKTRKSFKVGDSDEKNKKTIEELCSELREMIKEIDIRCPNMDDIGRIANEKQDTKMDVIMFLPAEPVEKDLKKDLEDDSEDDLGDYLGDYLEDDLFMEPKGLDTIAEMFGTMGKEKYIVDENIIHEQEEEGSNKNGIWTYVQGIKKYVSAHLITGSIIIGAMAGTFIIYRRHVLPIILRTSNSNKIFAVIH